MDNLEHSIEIENRYKAWVNNKIMILSLIISTDKVRNQDVLLRNEFFLEELEHHFMGIDVDKSVWRAFSYLKKYLKKFPHSSLRQRHIAIEMLALIYQELGFDCRNIKSNETLKV